jgi:hypothetical protein
MAKKATVAKMAIKSGMAGPWCIAHASLKNSTSAMLRFHANHQTLQFAGLSPCDLHQFALRLVRREAFTHARLKSRARDGKNLVVL